MIGPGKRGEKGETGLLGEDRGSNNRREGVITGWQGDDWWGNKGKYEILDGPWCLETGDRGFYWTCWMTARDVAVMDGDVVWSHLNMVSH